MFGRKQPATQRLDPPVAEAGERLDESADYASSGLSSGGLWLEHRQLTLAVGLDWRLCAQKPDQQGLRKLWKSRGMAGRFEVALPAGAILMAPCPTPASAEGYSAAALMGLHLTQAIVVANLASGNAGTAFWVCRVSGGRPVLGCDVLLPDQAAAQALVAAWLEDSLQATTVYGDIPGAVMSSSDLFSEVKSALRTGFYGSKDLRQARFLRLGATPALRRLWFSVLPLGVASAGMAYWWWSLSPQPVYEPAVVQVPVRTDSHAEQEAERQRLEQERVARVRAELQARFDADVQAAHERLKDRMQEAWRAALETASATPLHQAGAQVQGFRCLREAQRWLCTYDWRSPHALSRTRLLDWGVSLTSTPAGPTVFQQFSTRRELPQFPSWQAQALWPSGLSDEHLPLWLADLFQGLRFAGARLSPPTDEVFSPANYQKDGVSLEGEPVTVARYHPLDLTLPVNRGDVLYRLGAFPLLVDEFELRAGAWNIKARLVGPLTLSP